MGGRQTARRLQTSVYRLLLGRVERGVNRLLMENFGPIRRADFCPGDLTVLVGPQASGKSILLQTVKAVLDMDAIVDVLKLHGYSWTAKPEAFIELMYGEGMSSLVRPDTVVRIDGEDWNITEASKAAWSKQSRARARVFYVPAQRVLTIQEGWPRAFTSFNIEVPYVVKQFSEDLRRLMEGRVEEATLFPTPHQWKKEIRDRVGDAVFHGAEVRVDEQVVRKRIVLQVPSHDPLPFHSWSAGQREFIPLMLGLYFLTPTQATARRQGVEWAIVEEPEMGLHPAAISAVALVLLDLVKRGYKVIVSTHSPHLLEVVWALGRLKRALLTDTSLVARLFGVEATPGLREIGAALAEKETRVYFLGHTIEGGVEAKDISSLDPNSEDPDVANWGGLTDFAERASKLVSETVLFG